MAGYLIADIEITNPTLYEEFAVGIKQLAESRNGKFLVRGGATEVVEGGWTPHRIVVVRVRKLRPGPGLRPFRRIPANSPNSVRGAATPAP